MIIPPLQKSMCSCRQYLPSVNPETGDCWDGCCANEDALRHQDRPAIHFPLPQGDEVSSFLFLAAGINFYFVLSAGHFSLTMLYSVLEFIIFQTLSLVKYVNVFGSSFKNSLI